MSASVDVKVYVAGSSIPASRDGKNSFDVFGITSCDPNKVRSASFYQQCMEIALRNLELDHEEIDDDPFFTDDDELVE